MTYKKTIASYKKEDGTWVQQVNIDMGPLEQAMTDASYSLGDHQNVMPNRLTMEERVNALSNPVQGAAWITTQDANYTVNYNSWKAKHDSLEADYKNKNDAYNNQMATLPPGTQTC